MQTVRTTTTRQPTPIATHSCQLSPSSSGGGGSGAGEVLVPPSPDPQPLQPGSSLTPGGFPGFGIGSESRTRGLEPLRMFGQRPATHLQRRCPASGSMASRHRRRCSSRHPCANGPLVPGERPLTPGADCHLASSTAPPALNPGALSPDTGGWHCCPAGGWRRGWRRL